MSEFQNKIDRLFPDVTVRKDLVKEVKGNAVVPSYVLEYLLGQYCTTKDEDTIRRGIQSVRDILREHYVHRNEAHLVQASVRERGSYRVIDRVKVYLDAHNDQYVATFANMGINNARVDYDACVKPHPKLLTDGVWCIADIEYEKKWAESDEVKGGGKGGNKAESRKPWHLVKVKPIQMSNCYLEEYLEARREFSMDEWIDLIIRSIGFDPAMLNRRNKFYQLMRLVPYCERNYNLIELGPKGTGKSHIFQEFSPHGILISGSMVTAAKLFVNNQTGQIGLVGYWDCVAFDEFAGKMKRTDKALVDIMKNYMANKSFSRGVETLGAEASMTFIGNTEHTVPEMLTYADLFCDLPDEYHDSAFLDRLHNYIPGWEVNIIRGELFTNENGFIVDYFAEVLKKLRQYDFSDLYRKYFTLSKSISTRDKDGIQKTFAGLMKIIFPHGEATREEMEELLQFAIEGRKRVKDQLFRIDATYDPVEFYYETQNGKRVYVTTQEERDYPAEYASGESKAKRNRKDLPKDKTESEQLELSYDDRVDACVIEQAPVGEASVELISQKEVANGPNHLKFEEGETGVTYEKLFEPYLKGAKKIVITDPYILQPYQFRNLMDLMEMLIDINTENEEISVCLVTSVSRDPDVQEKAFEDISEAICQEGVYFSWQYNDSIHARHIVTDTGWKILLDRGLDIFQNFEKQSGFALAIRHQKYRKCKNFEITYIRENE